MNKMHVDGLATTEYNKFVRHYFMKNSKLLKWMLFQMKQRCVNTVAKTINFILVRFELISPAVLCMCSLQFYLLMGFAFDDEIGNKKK